MKLTDISSFRNPVRGASLAAGLLIPMAVVAASASQGQWPSWRGPNGTASIESGKYPSKWSSETVKWKTALPGKGTSTPIVWGERIFLTSPSEGQDAVIAFDFSGKQIWQAKLGPESKPKHQTLASGCNASPVTDGKGIFVYFKSGNFAALEMDGKVRWQINLVEKYGREQLFWDTGVSPVLTEGNVVLARMHGGESWVAAFDKGTGELRWQQARNYKAPTENDNGYATPVLFDHKGKPALLVWGADHLTAHDAADGKVLWSCGGFNPKGTGFWPAIATPSVVGDVAVIPVGRDDRGQAEMHSVKLGGSGDVTQTHRGWQRDDTGVFVTTPAVYKGKIYLLRHRGEVVCLDPNDGKTLWTGKFPEHRTPYYSSPVIASGILYAAREDGVVFAARVEDKFEMLGENDMGERIIASPVPAANRLFIRGDQHLFCVAGE